MKKSEALAYNILMLLAALMLVVHYATMYLHEPYSLEADAARAENLSKTETPEAYRELSGYLEYPNPYVRVLAAAPLWEFDDPVIKDRILSRLPREDNGLVKLALISNLGLLRERRAAPLLIPLLKEGDAGYAASAAYALGYMGEKSAAGPIAEVLSDKNSAVRQNAARGLSMLAASESIPPLLAALENEKDPETALLIKTALLESGESSYEEAVKSAVHGDNIPIWLRAWCARAMAKHGDAEAAQGLIDMLVSPEFFHAAYMLWRWIYPDMPLAKLHQPGSFPGEMEKAARWIVENKFGGKLKMPTTK